MHQCASRIACAAMPSAAAVGTLSDRINATGWSRLEVHGLSTAIDDNSMARAVGHLEGYLTADRMHLHWENAWFTMFDSPSGQLPEGVSQYLNASLAWLQSSVDTLAGSDPYWGHVGVILNQFYGLLDGFNEASRPEHRLSNMQLLAL